MLRLSMEARADHARGGGAGAGLAGRLIFSRFYKVPEDQRRANPEAYQPYLFYFGPYRYINLAGAAGAGAGAAVFISSHAQVAEEGDHFKRQGASKLCPDNVLLQKRLSQQVWQDMSNIQDMYAQTTPNQWRMCLDGRPLKEVIAEALALDAIAIVAAAVKPGKFFPAFPIGRLLLGDALLLENQLPLSVLRSAFQCLGFSGSFEEKVVKTYCKFANPFPHYDINSRPWSELQARRKGSDSCLLGSIYNSLTPNAAVLAPASAAILADGEAASTASEEEEEEEEEADASGIIMQFKPFITRATDVRHSLRGASLLSASHLERCGIRCRPIPISGSHGGAAPELAAVAPAGVISGASFDGICFNQKDKVLELPTILVAEDTMRFLHNLLAYEATSRYPNESFAISYCHFMNCLIDTSKDVELLVNAKVIQNFMGSADDVAAAWNRLCNSVSYRSAVLRKEYHINGIIGEVEKLVQNRWRRCRAAFLKFIYWEEKPWLLLSILAATTLFVLAFLQTVYTMKTSRF